MINVFDVYESAADKINPSQNGYFSFAWFNRNSWLAQLRCLDWLSGDVSDIIPPQPYLSQKNKDYLSPFIKKYPVQVENGAINKPEDFYGWENAYLLGNYYTEIECEDDTQVQAECNIPIELLNGDQFYMRCNTYIVGLKPSFKKPIAKEIAGTFEFAPQDLGSITLEYYKYPISAFLAEKLDDVYNQPIYDSTKSIDFEWPPFAQEILAWFIANAFSDWTREQALKQFNQLTGKVVRESK